MDHILEIVSFSLHPVNSDLHLITAHLHQGIFHPQVICRLYMDHHRQDTDHHMEVRHLVHLSMALHMEALFLPGLHWEDHYQDLQYLVQLRLAMVVHHLTSNQGMKYQTYLQV